MKQTSKPKKGDIQTYSGVWFNLLNPRKEKILLVDISHALSQINRFTGHTQQPYSVADHCVLVSDLCPPKLKLAGLLHDSAEFALGDVSTPLKKQLATYVKIENRLLSEIGSKFGVSLEDFEATKPYDLLALKIEVNSLMKYPQKFGLPKIIKGLPLKYKNKKFDKITPRTPKEAKLKYLETFLALTHT